MKLGNHTWTFGSHVYVCGILNATPDSFADGGRYDTVEAALRHAERMVDEGADLIDVGGESTRPGYTPVSAEEEIARVVPVIEAIHSRFDIPISVDTYKAAVADAAVEAGAGMINDIWGAMADVQMAEVMAKYPEVAVCLMHNRRDENYGDFLRDVREDLMAEVQRVRDAGVLPEQIIIDPGIGFVKSHEQNLFLLNHLDSLQDLGYPILLGTSRKRVVGLTLNLPVEERLEGTLATNVIGIMKGARVLRVHDVKEHVRIARMTEAILNAE